LISLLVHLKSQIDRNGLDPGGRDRRRAELEKLIHIYQEIDFEFKKQSPIILGGDFNGLAALPNPDIEFAAIYRETNLKDCLDVAQVFQDERFTYQQIYNNRVGIHRQIDYIFIPPSLASRVDAKETWVFRYRDEGGKTQLVPRTFNEKRLLPSDHYPVILTLNSGIS
jgi:endonuclease/exonuclease/phosphatase family metal-dependent hydrolase